MNLIKCLEAMNNQKNIGYYNHIKKNAWKVAAPIPYSEEPQELCPCCLRSIVYYAL